MQNVAKALIVLAVIAFILAIASAYTGVIGNIASEGYSRASNNLALLAIALAVCFKKSSSGTSTETSAGE